MPNSTAVGVWTTSTNFGIVIEKVEEEDGKKIPRIEQERMFRQPDRKTAYVRAYILRKGKERDKERQFWAYQVLSGSINHVSDK